MAIAGKQNLKELRKCSRKWQVYYYILYIKGESKGKTWGGGCYMKFIGDRLDRQEKSRGEISRIG